MKIQSTDWLAEFCEILLDEVDQINVACDSEEMINTFSSKMRCRNKIKLNRNEVCCSSGRTVLYTASIWFTSEGVVHNLLIGDWVGVFDQKQSADFYKKLFDLTPRDAVHMAMKLRSLYRGQFA
jgi:hypothetical protein